jgi:hypothetical protein
MKNEKKTCQFFYFELRIRYKQCKEKKHLLGKRGLRELVFNVL